MFRTLILASTLALAACSGGEAEQRVDLEPKPEFASEPIESPDTTGAAWSGSAESGTLRFGKLGEPPLFSIECKKGQIILSRHAPADPGAQALMPLIGNGTIARLPVDAVADGDTHIWQGAYPTTLESLDVFLGSNGIEATVPGAGSIDLAGSPEPGSLITRCRQSLQPPLPSPIPRRPDPEASQPTG